MKIDIIREHDEASRVDAIASTLPCPNCAAPKMAVKHIGIDGDWNGAYAPGCYVCGYIEGQGVVKNISTVKASVESEYSAGYRSKVE
jgi:hypothetical protein